jgi:DNA-binding transcriptional LysR family regulator
MELRRLRYFLRIAADGSLTKAAGVLRIAQPALSRQMRLLEQELGMTLFNRSSRGMFLSTAGEQLRDKVAGPLRELDLALESIASDSQGLAGTFTIGMPPSIGDLVATPLAVRMKRSSPNIKLRIVEGPTGSLIDWLNRGVVDFALLEDAARSDQMRERKLAALQLVFAGPADSPFAKDRALSLDVVLQQPLLLPAHHLGLRAVIDDAAAGAKARPNVCLEVDSSRVINDLLEAGMGYALLPRCYLRHTCNESPVRTWHISDAAPTLGIFLATRKNSQVLGGPATAIEDAIATLVSELLV